MPLKFPGHRAWLATLALMASAASAQTPPPTSPQPLNPRWHGSWHNGADRLVITADTVRTGEATCRWVSARPKAAPKGCVAFYDRGIPKSYLVGLFDQAEREIGRKAQDRQNRLDPADRKTMLDDLARNRRVLADVSDDVFRSMVLESAEAAGDCTGFFFIDRDVVYEATSCPYPEANSLRAYRRQP